MDLPFNPIIHILLIIIVYLCLVHLFHRGASRWFRVKKRKSFSSEYINAQHEKGDKFIRSVAVVTLLVGLIVAIMSDFESFFFRPYIIVALFFVIQQGWRAYMERKWLNDKRESTFTIVETGYHIILMISILTTYSWLY
ncbi:DUF4181 domain-containing protein [Bacillus sp. KH172YL63]|uniref:DUF4181 domain-containing protein n=1 Tax=Bacillus sp. KH172YL63 TaxID=2709784 RepID=UPI0013E42A4E|nr:DUF4181 domain-containing protein [Bacillus sp. KH172YL63]BCB03969.1 hypothetical protein KH172YL63_21020 [Bacillus sp. KH172YL63]